MWIGLTACVQIYVALLTTEGGTRLLNVSQNVKPDNCPKESGPKKRGPFRASLTRPLLYGRQTTSPTVGYMYYKKPNRSLKHQLVWCKAAVFMSFSHPVHRQTDFCICHLVYVSSADQYISVNIQIHKGHLVLSTCNERPPNIHNIISSDQGKSQHDLVPNLPKVEEPDHWLVSIWPRTLACGKSMLTTIRINNVHNLCYCEVRGGQKTDTQHMWTCRHSHAHTLKLQTNKQKATGFLAVQPTAQ